MTGTALQGIDVATPRRKWARYVHYKPTEIGWINRIPQDWDARRLKHLGKAIIGLTYSPVDICEKDEGTLVLRASNIQDGKIALEDNVYVNSPIPHELRTRENDVLICSRNGSQHLVGKCAYIGSEHAGHSFGAFTTVFRSKFNRYLFWLFSSGMMTQQAGMYQTSTIFQLTSGILNEFRVPLPPLDEQRTIAAFLDRETTRIDELIAKKERLIELLKEKRHAVISRAVTKGLDPNTPMKPSGIDWLGKVPGHWELKKLKYLAAIQAGENITALDFYENGDYLVYGGNGIRGRAMAFTHDGDYVLIGRQGALCGNVHRVRGKFWASEHASVATCRKEVNVDWFATLIEAMELKRYSETAAQPGLAMERISRLQAPVPKDSEQEKIADFVRLTTHMHGQLTEKVNHAIDRLLQYRSALITAAVTGQIDVRQGVA